jgi:hypothetical protein
MGDTCIGIISASGRSGRILHENQFIYPASIQVKITKTAKLDQSLHIDFQSNLTRILITLTSGFIKYQLSILNSKILEST